MTTNKPRPVLPAGSVDTFPVLPLRDIVVFPHMIVPLFVGREKSIRALEEVMRTDRHILLATQLNATEDDPSIDAIYKIGSLATVLQLLKLPDGTVKVLVEGVERAQVRHYTAREEFYEAEAEVLGDGSGEKVEAEALARSVISEFESYVKLNKKVSPEVVAAVTQIDDYSKLADTIASHLAVKIPEKQSVLEILAVPTRLEKVLSLMESEISVLQVEKRIRTRVKRQMEKTQREYYLNEQMKAIQKELGDEEGKDELGELEQKIKATKLSKEARDKAQAEMKKLRQMSPMSAEATVVRNYLDWLISLPWGDKSRIKKDLPHAQEILDADHHGLDKVKERIVEYLAVQQRANRLTGPILCLVGPPGVGKTSLAKSIARATGREYVRMSLGGVRDEAEIRGHRRTYVGALPGRIVRAIREAGSMNPVVLLDEVDKMGVDFRGDPASALLEVLDPAQNHTFRDHYLELELDLSDVLFLATANVAETIPAPLLDRMELVTLDGYTEDEKVAIARNHLWPRQLERAALGATEVTIDDGALHVIAGEHTREAGVRQLERAIAKVLRKATTKLAADPGLAPLEITTESLREYLGRPRFTPESAERTSTPGVATGLAVTGAGGDVLFIEAAAMPGDRGLTLTGQLGDVMKESAQIALSYLRSHGRELGVDPTELDRALHLHVPAGAVPKDGPSAGVTMVTALASLATGRPVRSDVGMTGEVTLNGRVLPIGGVKQKLLAAHRAGLTTVFLPERNGPDLDDVPASVRQAVDVRLVSDVADLVREALEPARSSALAA